MLEEMKKKVCEANKLLQRQGLVKFNWGNVSEIDRASGILAIKPSGVSYEKLTPEMIVLVDLNGNVVEGDLRPSSDTPTHIELYKAFPEIGGIAHTHSKWATIMAQSGVDIMPYGTTHADHFYGAIPCTGPLTDEQINGEYERETGLIIADTIIARGNTATNMPACLVLSHGPFTWGKDSYKAVFHSVVLEEVSMMAWHTMQMPFANGAMQPALIDKHYLRKNGENAYYGQKK